MSCSSTKEEAEAIMICLDNSYWMESTKSPMFKEQADAIEFYCIRIGGELRFLEAAANAHSGLVGELYTPMKKRIVFFAGRTSMLASDVITFGNPYYKKRKVFDCFIQSANNKGNDCNICHVPPESSISEALSRSQIIIPRAPSSISGAGGSISKPPSSISGAIDIYVKAPSESTDVPFAKGYF
ncbi:hypothetical protein Tco_1261885 [Tanacetum coccineum]